MVSEPVEQGSGEPLRAEHAGPLVERQIAGHDHRAALIAPTEYLEQQLRPGGRQRHIAQLVDDQQPVGRELLLQAQQPALVPGLDQFVDQGRRRGEADRKALLTGGQPEPESDMGLADAGRSSVILPGVRQ